MAEKKDKKSEKDCKKSKKSETKNKKAVSAFEEYLYSLGEEDRELVTGFFSEYNRIVTLGRGDKARIREDFERAFLWYAENGVSLGEALSRLDTKNLGGFYSRGALLWYPLDDAAKVYPLSMKRGQMHMFRLSVYLKKEVVPEILQMALTFTIKRFPVFATTVKKGFFWHYLDMSKRRYSLEEDSGRICRPLKIAYSGSPAFRMIYYKNRITAEVFHVLTDGTGAMVFLKSLTAEYLRLLGITSSFTEGVFDVNGQPTEKEVENEFTKAPKTDKASGFMDKSAVQLSGDMTRIRPYRVLNFNMSSSKLREVSKEYGGTVTAYLTSQLFVACRYATDCLKGDFNIQTPVNLRKFFPTQSLRNFSLYCGIRMPVEKVTTAREIISDVSRQLTEKTCVDAMKEMVTSTARLVSSVRYIPLCIKVPVARLIYGFLGERLFTCTLTNIGVAKMPPEIAEHIESFEPILGGMSTNRVGCSFMSYGDNTIFTISTMTKDPSFEEKLYELLTADGIDVRVEGSVPHEG